MHTQAARREMVRAAAVQARALVSDGERRRRQLVSQSEAAWQLRYAEAELRMNAHEAKAMAERPRELRGAGGVGGGVAGVGALVGYWLSTLRPRLVVWDFDQTVLRIHAYAEGVRAAEVGGRWREDVADLELISTFVRTAHREGCHVAIASFGSREVICEYMRHLESEAGVRGAFSEANIVTPSALGYAHTPATTPHLRTRARSHGRAMDEPPRTHSP